MARYLLKFSKKGGIRFISHLDMLRVFQRAFRRAGIDLSYSNGFNPHPRIGFAMPLSLGFESDAEYLEFETDTEYAPDEAMSMMKDKMPPGIEAVACRKLKDTSKKAAAAALARASYTALYKGGDGSTREKITGALQGFLAQEHVMSVKYSKKKKKDIESDIRPNIYSLSSVSENRLLLSMLLGAGNTGSLNPEVMLKELCRFCGVEYNDYEWLYTRTEMFFLDKKGRIKPLTDFEG
ncbi:MAG: TIGR03936 family radical SAM-associated protein [Anaerovoracaceae bacterium]|nr:TIGR03936 family radical SAM-associated protein [Bacillota bacterium]MDY2670067.1 TIGR03936 family radical SAM-associated protein [Anaerovoracaceae bacterium]